MKTHNRDPYANQDQDIRENHAQSEEVLYQFEVVPVDEDVVDMRSPTLYITPTRLFFAYDKIIEEYDLATTELQFLGAAPRFKLWQQLMEFRYKYSPNTLQDILSIRNNEQILRFSVGEAGLARKDFIFRWNSEVQRAYKTWAMGQIIINVKNGQNNINPALVEMIDGDFVNFNYKTILYFALASLFYFLMSWFLTPQLHPIFGTIIDVLYVIILLLMGAWLYMSMSKDLKRYESVYFSYQMEMGVPEDKSEVQPEQLQNEEVTQNDEQQLQ